MLTGYFYLYYCTFLMCDGNLCHKITNFEGQWPSNGSCVAEVE